jgi:hypothetical protein
MFVLNILCAFFSIKRKERREEKQAFFLCISKRILILLHVIAGFALVHGQIMERGQVVFMHVTVMRLQSKREWYIEFFQTFSFLMLA